MFDGNMHVAGGMMFLDSHEANLIRENVFNTGKCN